MGVALGDAVFGLASASLLPLDRSISRAGTSLTPNPSPFPKWEGRGEKRVLRSRADGESDMSQNRQIQLVELPKDKLGLEHFKLGSVPMPQAKDGEVLLRV